MTLFEYVSVAVSLVLALAIARTVDGLQTALDRRRRYWVHAAWVVIKLFNPVIFWWGLWSFRESSWNFLGFSLVLAWPVGLYLQVSSLVTRDPENVADWLSHFYSQRIWFFGANALLNVLVMAMPYSMGSTLPAVSAVAVSLLVVLSLVGLATENRVAHGVIVVAVALNALIGFAVRLYSPVPPGGV